LQQLYDIGVGCVGGRKSETALARLAEVNAAKEVQIEG
jgi:hypothetical protein